MRFLPARRWLLAFLLFVVFLFILPSVVRAAPTSSPTPTIPTTDTSQWAFDPETTEVGKNSERGRQFLWWVLSHPGIHSSPVLVQLWSISRNIVFVFIILVIVTLGIGLILSSRKTTLGPIFSGISSPVAGLNLPSVFLKVGMVLLYVTFSYILIIALIQISEIMMRFFIETVGGRDLFNVIFAGAGNRDENYISFIGYRDLNPLNQEMANTSLFLIRTTSLTYFVMALMLVLRTIILWFLLVVAPFLAILMPFVFIRNTGWIWIGVFFQWLFYGPLFALFLATITKIWIFGIPFPFDFSRVNKPEGQVYKTAINILYGGPAQTINPGNSANYIDTYAEYMIALVMLWTSIILPWLLLRIFRDYCCAGIAAAGATLNAIFDRFRQYPPPPSMEPTKVPVTVTGIGLELPFRQKVKEEIKITEKTHVEEIHRIKEETTSEITRKMDISVSKLSDIGRFETDKVKRDTFQSQLQKIKEPHLAATPVERVKYQQLKGELTRRAVSGDVLAKSILTASDSRVETMVAGIPMGAGRPMVAAPGVKVGVYAPSISTVTGGPTVVPTSSITSILSSSTKVKDLASQSKISENKVREILQAVPITGIINAQTISAISQKTQVVSDKVQQVLAVTSGSLAAVKAVPSVTIPIGKKEVATSVPIEDYEEVKKMWLKHYREAPIPVTETIQNRREWLEEESKKLTNISNLLASSDPALKNKGFEQVAELLPFLLLGGFSDVETITYLKAKVEAAKQTSEELEAAEKVKEEAKQEIKEEEETLLEVSPKKKEEKKVKTAAQEEAMEIPEDKEKNQEGKQTSQDSSKPSDNPTAKD
jgi:hypothetical protein